ncbi:protoheme IX farnesyltransferase [Carboxylicivirga linearis]|uniref:heme o synthase n=1 Tax=Carboxylicivirga linearis TaxID=1628157 RepID=A0ABS5JPX4_9BACT|nr:protoheme IX farnesyltransferase [Carboxylicivirga linearis]MBS2096893.1 protoheme IX farnesyltransferase [Carboxylicivirga linearis]
MSLSFLHIKTLGKLSISLPVALTAYTGYIIYDESLSVYGLLVAVGIFFLSAGASSLNQMQEQKFDALMSRTANRPLPLGVINGSSAFVITFLFFLVGTFALLPFGIWTVISGWMGVLWYNLFYTPMKRWSAFSVFPGAVVGAIPPVAGWIAAGGSILDVRIHFLALFFFLGQMPHFWLLVLKYGDQYRKAGFPVITDVLSEEQINRINLVWFLATFISAMFLPFFNVITNRPVVWIITISTILMMAWSVRITLQVQKEGQSLHLRKMFLYFNSFYLWVMILIYVDQI